MACIRKKIEGVMRGTEPPGAMRPLLSVIESAYSFGVGLRNRAYDTGTFKPVHVRPKIISVGNLTVGGSGKTPFVELVVRKLAPRKAGILSRGYGGGSGEPVHVVSDGSSLSAPPPVSADEPYMLARRLKGVPVVCAPQREKGAAFMSDKFDLDAIVLDDGFQRRSIHRDLDILLVDACVPFASARLIPLGMLREPVAGSKRADIIVITNAQNAGKDSILSLKKEIQSAAGADKPIVTAGGRNTGFFDLHGAKLPAPDGPVFFFCGIANPERFEESLKAEGVTIEGKVVFPDHHQYSDDDISKVFSEAGKSKPGMVVTTEKDAVRLLNLKLPVGDLTLAYAGYETFIVDGEDLLDLAIDRVFGS
ncbi:MAG: tetraacyldisaccharide 4'-kinase [Nitrospinae bacterium]|nr:tetraacyldisaccharide 4'-kinase [Nitrospinota bacterium]MBF0633169.1 tetraacyldisaccharide 4'-kinase [Nitrospinota bacterium]